MAFKKKKNKICLGVATTMLFTTVFIIILSALLSKLGLQAEKNVLSNGSLMVSFTSIKNFLSVEGIKYLFSNVILNFRMIEPLAFTIVSIIAFGILEASGLMQMCFSPLKKVTNKSLTIIVLLISFISTFFGEYSFAVIVPFIGALYSSLGKNAAIGILTSFLGISLGYGSGFIFNYDQVLLGILTQSAATSSEDKNYVFNNFSTSIIMTVSLIIFVPIVGALIESYIAPYFGKNTNLNTEKNMSKKAFFYSTLSFVVLLLFSMYLIVPGFPGSGILLDLEQNTYFEKLFSTNSPFREGICLILLALTIIPSYIYGKISKNLETSTGVSDSLALGLNDCGFLLLIVFLGSIMISVLEWTGMGDFILCKVVEILSKFQLSGILLLVIFFISMIIVTIFVPSTLTKWSLISPVIVPLFMRANITPDFTQFIFQVADGVGKSISIFFPYFLIMMGLMQKYNYDDAKITVGGTIKRILPVVAITAALWILFLVIWYLAGFPVGLNEYTTI